MKNLFYNLILQHSYALSLLLKDSIKLTDFRGGNHTGLRGYTAYVLKTGIATLPVCLGPCQENIKAGSRGINQTIFNLAYFTLKSH